MAELERDRVREHLAGHAQPTLDESARAHYRERIAAQLKARNAVLVAHYYTDPEIQALAEATGGCVADSLEMARFGKEHPATTLIEIGRAHV